MTQKFNIITGAAGYIGKVLGEHLNKKKIKFIGIDKYPRKDKSIIKLDLKNKKKTLKFFKKINCNKIYHFGTYSAAAYKKNFNKCFKEDLISLQNLLKSIETKTNKIKIIYMSSSYVYSGYKSKKKTGVCEEKNLTPVHDFGFAKKFFEEFLTKYHSNSIIYRLSNVFGEGEFIRGNTIYNMVIEAKKHKIVTVWGKGNRKLQYIYIGDLMKYLLLNKNFNGIFNLGGNEYIKISTLTKKISYFFGTKVLFLKNKKEGETLSFMNTRKIKNITKNYFTEFDKNLISYLGTF